LHWVRSLHLNDLRIGGTRLIRIGFAAILSIAPIDRADANGRSRQKQQNCAKESSTLLWRFKARETYAFFHVEVTSMCPARRIAKA
jgi:hypothetical protein